MSPGACREGCPSAADLMDARELAVTCSSCCSAASAFCLAAANPACPARSSSFSSREFLSSAWGEGQNP